MTTLSEKVTILEDTPAPGKAPSGLAWDGRSFWHHDGERGQGRLFRIGRGGAVEFSCALPDGCCDTEFDGAHVWQAAPHTGDILVISPESGEIVRRVSVHARTSGLVFDGASWWRGDWDRAEIIRFDPRTGRELESIKTAHSTSGIAYDGQFFWHGVSDGDTNLLVQVDPDGGAREKFALDFPAHGVTFDGADLWVVDGKRHRFVRLRVEAETW